MTDSVSRCGRSGPLLLASFHCYVAHFNCEQELNSTCSRRILDQPTCWRRHALLSNARLTFPPQEVFRHSPKPSVGRHSPDLIAGKASIRAAMTAIHIEVSIPCTC